MNPGGSEIGRLRRESGEPNARQERVCGERGGGVYGTCMRGTNLSSMLSEGVGWSVRESDATQRLPRRRPTGNVGSNESIHQHTCHVDTGTTCDTRVVLVEAFARRAAPAPPPLPTVADCGV